VRGSQRLRDELPFGLRLRKDTLLKVGLTGGIASGKSVVGELFAARGVHLIQADHIAHELMQPGQAVYEEVVRHFGTAILNPDGSVNRPKLAEAAFGHPEQGGSSRVTELNQIVHPAVIRRQDEWMEEVGRRDPHAIAMVEAALIIEAGAAERFDRLIVVTCSEEQREQRFAQRLNIDAERACREVQRRMAAQLPDSVKIKKSDYVIDNSGSLDATETQVRQVHALLKEEAEKTP
jgi:dephospho-CoA kinase